MRVVLDTNQFISALIRKDGHPAQIVQAWRQGEVELVVSPTLLEEVLKVLHRPHIKNKYYLTDEEIEEYVLLLRRYALITPGKVTTKVVVDDPDDDMIIACAVEAKADYIVSGDLHLLDLKEYQGILIIRASDFLQILKG